jgi:hypothetical protein
MVPATPRHRLPQPDVRRVVQASLVDAGVERIVAKDLHSTYRAGPTNAWVKAWTRDTHDALLLAITGAAVGTEPPQPDPMPTRAGATTDHGTTPGLGSAPRAPGRTGNTRQGGGT